MTHTISWGLFAPAQLFLHDLATIGNIQRISARIATGVIAFPAPFLYQRLFARSTGR